MPDHIDDFLDTRFPDHPADELRTALRQKTTHLLRLRKWRRRLLLVGAAAACYCAGLATIWLMPPRTVVVEKLVPGPPIIVEKKVDPVIAEVKLPPRAAEREFEAQTGDPARRAAKLREAGDLYLEQEQDYAAALRCYTLFFNAGGPEALEFSPDDNWLVMALKNARRKEKGL